MLTKLRCLTHEFQTEALKVDVKHDSHCVLDIFYYVIVLTFELDHARFFYSM